MPNDILRTLNTIDQYYIHISLSILNSYIMYSVYIYRNTTPPKQESGTDLGRKIHPICRRSQSAPAQSLLTSRDRRDPSSDIATPEINRKEKKKTLTSIFFSSTSSLSLLLLSLCSTPASLLCCSSAYFLNTIAIMPAADKKPKTLYDKVLDAHIVNEQEDGTILLYIGMSSPVLWSRE